MDVGYIIWVVLNLSILLFSVIMHEVAHGYVAYRLGDPTAKMSNRLSLNPINHIDPMGSIILPVLLALMRSSVMIGWAKPVPVDSRYFSRPRRDDFLVSIAGVTVNFIIAAIAALLFRTLGQLHNEALSTFLVMTCSMNVGLAVFNLLPVPPLDGSHVAAALMPVEMARRYMGMARYGLIVVFVLLYLGFVDVVMMPVIRILQVLMLGIPS